jgi:hypothetical protein
LGKLALSKLGLKVLGQGGFGGFGWGR